MKPFALISSVATVVAVVIAYFAIAIFVLHFQIDRILFPAVTLAGISGEQTRHSLIGSNGNTMLIRRYGNAEVGCVVFFPGQHGDIISYEKNLFSSYVAKGVAVFALSYPGQDGALRPGQDGALGQSEFDEVQMLALQAFAFVETTCPRNKTVFVGRSLGSMLAAYTAGVVHPAGLVLEAVAPSLSSAIYVRLHSRWYLQPLALLPVSKLLAHDYSLAEALPGPPVFPVTVFQGELDGQTPIEFLRETGALPSGTNLILVPGGTHSNSYLLAIDTYVQTTLRMIRHE